MRYVLIVMLLLLTSCATKEETTTWGSERYDPPKITNLKSLQRPGIY